MSHHHQHDKWDLIEILVQEIKNLTHETHGLLDKSKQIERMIHMNQQDLIAAATALSTASDAVSVKLDTLISKVDAAVAALANTDLTPAGETALSELQASAKTAAAAGDKVDAEVTKLDTILPVPAPAAPTV